MMMNPPGRKNRGSHGKQARKRKNKDKEGNSRMKDDDQIDLTRDESLDKEDVVEETDERRRQEVGKDRIMRGAKIEAKYEYEFKGISLQEIKDHAIMLIEDAETVRLKTKNMRGGLSGILKDRLFGLRNVIKCLLDKLEEKGDVTFFKTTKNNELLVESKRLKKEGEKWEHERTQKDKEIESYREMYENAENICRCGKKNKN